MLLTQIDGRGIVPVWNGVSDVAREHDANLILFAGKSLRSPFEDEFQHNVVYDIVCPENVDGLIAVSGSLSSYVGPEELEKFLQRYRGIPLVSLSVPYAGIPSVLSDNTSGMRDAVRHLLADHGRKRVAFIKGPDTNPEASQRFQAYRDVLKEFNIPFDPELVVEGDFRYNRGVEAVNLLVDERKVRFDAIAVSNDDMALGVYRELRQRGLSVPHDVALTGFDDIDEVQVLSVPFTTVHQPLYEQARRSCEILLDMMKGKAVEPVTVFPTRLVVRRSCGCLPLAVTDMNTDIRPVSVPSGRDMGAVVGPRKEEILNGIMAKMPIASGDQPLYRKSVSLLLDNFIEDVNNRVESGAFLKSLTDILSEMVVYENLLPFWHEALFVMRSVLVTEQMSPDVLHLAEGMFQRAQILISDVLYRRESYRSRVLDHLFWDLREIIRKINSTFEIHKLMSVVAEQLPLIGLHSCYISLYQSETEERKGDTWILPKYARLVMGYDEKGPINVERDDALYPVRRILPDFAGAGRRRTMVVEPLFDQDEHYGLIFFELGPREEVIYETLRKQISSTITSTRLFRARQVAEDRLKIALMELERSNRELQNLSLKDELTGLYNRRGLYILGEQQFRLTQRGGGKFVLFFGDVDGLKIINDTHGHKSGDQAIAGTAEILRQTFRHADILGRFGGDEFVIIAADSPGFSVDPEHFRKRLKDNLDAFNAKSSFPFTLSVSLGFADFDSGKATSFEQLMLDADKMLYEQKRARKRTGN